MAKTKNYNLTKPEKTEFYDVNIANENMDVIDEKMKELETKTETAFQYANNGKQRIKASIIGADDKVIIPEEPTFEQLAQAIDQIETGIDTSDATAEASHILQGKSAYVDNNKLDGTMVERGTTNYVSSTRRFSMINMLPLVGSNYSFTSNMNGWKSDKNVTFLTDGGYARGGVQLSKSDLYSSVRTNYLNITSGNKYYFACLVKPSSDLTNLVGHLDIVTNTVAIDFIDLSKLNLKSNEWNLISGIATAQTSSNNYEARLYMNCDSGTLLVDNFALFNLTDTFKGDNIPTLKEIDSIFTRCGYDIHTLSIMGVDDGGYVNVTPLGYPIAYSKTETIKPDNIRQNVEIFGQVGTYTSDGTITASDVVSGKKGYSQGKEVIGNMGSLNSIFHGDASSSAFENSQIIGSANNEYVGAFDYPIPNNIGYMQGSSNFARVHIANLIPSNIKYGVNIGGKNGYIGGSFTGDANLVDGAMLQGFSGYDKGQKIIGTMPDYASQIAPKNPDNMNVKSFELYQNEFGYGAYIGLNSYVYGRVDGNTILTYALYGVHPSVVKKGHIIGSAYGNVGTNKLVGTYEGEKKTASGVITGASLGSANFTKHDSSVLSCRVVNIPLNFKANRIVINYQVIANSFYAQLSTTSYQKQSTSVGYHDNSITCCAATGNGSDQGTYYTFPNNIGNAWTNESGFQMPLLYGHGGGTLTWFASE